MLDLMTWMFDLLQEYSLPQDPPVGTYTKRFDLVTLPLVYYRPLKN
jgi:hypothetical protein